MSEYVSPTAEQRRELDAAVHLAVFGVPSRLHDSGLWVYDHESPAFPGRGAKTIPLPVPDYSANMGEAWAVVEKLVEQEYVKVTCGSSHYHGDHCRITAPDKTQMDESSLVKRDAMEWGESMPLAICMAALAAVASPLATAVLREDDGEPD